MVETSFLIYKHQGNIPMKMLNYFLSLALALLFSLASHAENIDTTDKYAWSSNAGWVNFKPTHGGGVTVYTDHLEGCLG